MKSQQPIRFACYQKLEGTPNSFWGIPLNYDALLAASKESAQNQGKVPIETAQKPIPSGPELHQLEKKIPRLSLKGNRTVESSKPPEIQFTAAQTAMIGAMSAAGKAAAAEQILQNLKQGDTDTPDGKTQLRSAVAFLTEAKTALPEEIDSASNALDDDTAPYQKELKEKKDSAKAEDVPNSSSLSSSEISSSTLPSKAEAMAQLEAYRDTQSLILKANLLAHAAASRKERGEEWNPQKARETAAVISDRVDEARKSGKPEKHLTVAKEILTENNPDLNKSPAQRVKSWIEKTIYFVSQAKKARDAHDENPSYLSDCILDELNRALKIVDQDPETALAILRSQESNLKFFGDDFKAFRENLVKEAKIEFYSKTAFNLGVILCGQYLGALLLGNAPAYAQLANAVASGSATPAEYLAMATIHSSIAQGSLSVKDQLTGDWKGNWHYLSAMGQGIPFGAAASRISPAFLKLLMSGRVNAAGAGLNQVLLATHKAGSAEAKVVSQMLAMQEFAKLPLWQQVGVGTFMGATTSLGLTGARAVSERLYTGEWSEIDWQTTVVMAVGASVGAQGMAGIFGPILARNGAVQASQRAMLQKAFVGSPSGPSPMTDALYYLAALQAQAPNSPATLSATTQFLGLAKILSHAGVHFFPLGGSGIPQSPHPSWSSSAAPLAFMGSPPVTSTSAPMNVPPSPQQPNLPVVAVGGKPLPIGPQPPPPPALGLPPTAPQPAVPIQAPVPPVSVPPAQVGNLSFGAFRESPTGLDGPLGPQAAHGAVGAQKQKSSTGTESPPVDPTKAASPKYPKGSTAEGPPPAWSVPTWGIVDPTFGFDGPWTPWVGDADPFSSSGQALSVDSWGMTSGGTGSPRPKKSAEGMQMAGKNNNQSPDQTIREILAEINQFNKENPSPFDPLLPSFTGDESPYDDTDDNNLDQAMGPAGLVGSFLPEQPGNDDPFKTLFPNGVLPNHDRTQPQPRNALEKAEKAFLKAWVTDENPIAAIEPAQTILRMTKGNNNTRYKKELRNYAVVLEHAADKVNSQGNVKQAIAYLDEAILTLKQITPPTEESKKWLPELEAKRRNLMGP